MTMIQNEMREASAFAKAFAGQLRGYPLRLVSKMPRNRKPITLTVDVEPQPEEHVDVLTITRSAAALAAEVKRRRLSYIVRQAPELGFDSSWTSDVGNVSVRSIASYDPTLRLWYRRFDVMGCVQ